MTIALIVTARFFRRMALLAVVLGPAIAALSGAYAQEAVLLSESEAPAAVFPDADRIVRRVIPVTTELRDHLRAALGSSGTSVWEEQYVVFTATRGETLLGYAIIVEEIGKHRPITFVVGIRPDGRTNDVAVMAYREAYGGEIKSKRFLNQYRDKGVTDGLRSPEDIKNVAGATLSVEAATRAVKKALAMARLALLSSETSKPETKGGGSP